MRGKQPGAPGTPGVPEPSPSYPPANNAQGGDHIYELEDEPIVSHEIIPYVEIVMMSSIIEALYYHR